MSDDWRLRMQITGLVFLMLFVFWVAQPAHAQEYCGEWDQPSYHQWQMNWGSASFCYLEPHSPYVTPTGEANIAHQQALCDPNQAWPGNCTTNGYQWMDAWSLVQNQESWKRAIRTFQCKNSSQEPDGTNRIAIVDSTRTTVSTGEPPPWWGQNCYECPAAGTPGGNAIYPVGDSPSTCVDRGGGETCSMDPRPVSGGDVTVLCMGDTCRQPLQYTGATCTAENAPPAPDVAANNVTCVSMGGNLHCWHKEDVDCQRVNGESWCFSDVKVQPIITDGGQIITDDAFTPVVDSNDDKVTPDSTVDVTEGASSTTVEHYNSSTVITHGTSDPIAGNPAQGGGSGGPAGEGDGDEGGGGTASGGATCADPPVCDGDPVGCAILAQNWRQRCVDDGNFLEGSGLNELAEGESVFSALRDQDGDISNVSENLDSEGWLGASRECPSDVSLNFGQMVGMVTVPLSMLCPLLNLTGWLVMFFAGVASIRIIGGSV